MLTSALTILDSAPNLITQVTAATSKRSLYLVKASSNQNRKKYRSSRNETSPSSTNTPTSYICLIPPGRPSRTPPQLSSGNQHPLSSSSGLIYFCSCRSFLENTKNSWNTTMTMMNISAAAPSTSQGRNGSSIRIDESSTSCTRGVALCKHLLALVLRPYLHVPCAQLTVVSDEDFATLVLDRTFAS